MKPLNLSVLIVALASIVLSGCGSKLPQNYGVYIENEGNHVRFEPTTPEERRQNFSQNISFLVFDKALGSGLVNPSQVLQIYNRKYVRFSIEKIFETSNQPPSEIKLRKVQEWAAFGDAIAIDVEPIKGQPEMLRFKPKISLKPGFYFADVAGQRLSFGIQTGSTTGKESNNPLSDPLDKHYKTRSKDAQFSWGNWFEDAKAMSSDQETHLGGNAIFEKSFYATKKLDQEIAEMRQQAEQSLTNYSFAKARYLAEAVGTYEGKEAEWTRKVSETLFSTVKHYQSLGQPEVAAVYAKKLTSWFGNQIGEAETLYKACLKEIEGTELLKDKTVRDLWETQTNGVGKFLFTFTDNINFERKKIGEGSVTERFISSSQYDAPLWFGDIASIQAITNDVIVGRRILSEIMQGFPAIGIYRRGVPRITQFIGNEIYWPRGGDGSSQSSPQFDRIYWFTTSQERDEVLAKLVQVWNTWQNQGDRSKILKAAESSCYVEDDSVIYTIYLQFDWWSDCIRVPEGVLNGNLETDLLYRSCGDFQGTGHRLSDKSNYSIETGKSYSFSLGMETRKLVYWRIQLRP